MDEEDNLRHELLPLCAPQLGCACLPPGLPKVYVTRSGRALQAMPCPESYWYSVPGDHHHMISGADAKQYRGRRMLFGRDFRAHMEGAAMLEAALPQVPTPCHPGHGFAPFRRIVVATGVHVDTHKGVAHKASSRDTHSHDPGQGDLAAT